MTLVGSPFPDFTLLTDSGETLALSSLRGRSVVLYFYPQDDTTGCTRESCEFRDLLPRFTAGDAVILGISPDDVASHQKFKAKYSLPFTLLVDDNHALAERLGLWVEKQFMGNRYMGVQRTTYVIGEDGAIRHVFDKVTPAGHAEEVIAFLQGGVEAAHAARAAFDAAAAQAAAAVAVTAPIKNAVKKPAKPAAKPAARKVAKKVVKPAAKKGGKRLATKVAKKPAKKVAKKIAKKVAKKVVKKVAKKVVKKVVKKVSKKPAKKVAKRPAKKAVRKLARKPAKRTRKPAGKK